jgi:hypothetical protein
MLDAILYKKCLLKKLVPYKWREKFGVSACGKLTESRLAG